MVGIILVKQLFLVLYHDDDLLGKLPSNLEITYKAICENNQASNKELAAQTNQSERTIRNHTAKLKELNYIKRVGSDKTELLEISPKKV